MDFKLPKLIVEQPTTGKPRVTSPTYTLQLPPIGKSSSLVAEQYSPQRKPTYAAAPRIMSRIKSCKSSINGNSTHHDSYMEQFRLECERRGNSSNIHLLPDLAIKHQSKRDKAGPISKEMSVVKFYFDEATDSFCEFLYWHNDNCYTTLHNVSILYNYSCFI